MSQIRHKLFVRSERPPVVEFDPEAGAVYVKFSDKPIAKTLERSSDGPVVTVDVDKNGDVVGVEGVSFDEFTIAKLLRAANVAAERIDFARATLRAASRHNVKEHALA